MAHSQNLQIAANWNEDKKNKRKRIGIINATKPDIKSHFRAKIQTIKTICMNLPSTIAPDTILMDSYSNSSMRSKPEGIYTNTSTNIAGTKGQLTQLPFSHTIIIQLLCFYAYNYNKVIVIVIVIEVLNKYTITLLSSDNYYYF